MIHGFTEKEWNDYLEGCAAENLQDRLEAHLIGCLSCWELHHQLAHTTEALRASGALIRAQLSLQDSQLHAGLRGVFEKLRASEAAHPEAHHAIRQRLEELAAVMTLMCGSQTAVKALRAAAQDSPARSLDGVTADNWTQFLQRLKSIAAVMCGDTGAHLVWESGQF